MRLLWPPATKPPLDAELSDEDLEGLYAPPPRRHVRAGFVSSLDSAIELDGHSGGLGGSDDHRVFATLRAVCDVVVVGSGTAITENYGPAKLNEAARGRRVARGQGVAPPIAVVNSAASLDPGSRLFTEHADALEGTPRPIVLCAASAPAGPRRQLAALADIVECGDDRVELDLVLDALAERGLSSVLCEGGPTLTNGLIGAGLLDELCLSQAMLLAGPGHKTFSEGTPLPQAVALRLGHLVLGDAVLLGRWELAR